MNKFSERLRESLRANNMTQVELAKKINMSQEIVNNYCTGRHEPSFDTLILICQVLGESSDYLLGISD